MQILKYILLFTFEVLPWILMTMAIFTLSRVTIRQSKRIRHLESLVNILGKGISETKPMVQETFSIFQNNPDISSEDLQKKLSFRYGQMHQEHLKRIEILLEITEDEDKREFLKSVKNKITDAYNLIATVDENSSPEYSQQVLSNVLELFQEGRNL